MGRKSGTRWSSRFTATWRSVLSWMHWRRRRNQRELEKLEQMLDMFQQLLAAQRHRMLEDVQTLLLDALQPMAEAMQRQDELARSLAGRIRQDLGSMDKQATELLMEVLQTLHPPAREMLGLPPGPQKPPPSFPASAISARR